MPRLVSGESFAPIQLQNIHGAPVSLPDSSRKWVHLHFARFAACPICNVHLQSLIAGSHKLLAANVREVVLFHSSVRSLLPYQGHFPFDVVGDPNKQYYTQFNIGSSVRSMLDPRAWPSMVRGSLDPKKPKGTPEGGMFGLPADCLIAPDGRIKAVHYGKHAADSWTVEQIVSQVKS